MDLTIRTDHKWKEFDYGIAERMTEKQRKEFDYMKEEDFHSATFIRYKDWIYELGDFERIPNGMFPRPWNGYLSETFFSGILIEISDDRERYRIGMYFS